MQDLQRSSQRSPHLTPSVTPSTSHRHRRTFPTSSTAWSRDRAANSIGSPGRRPPIGRYQSTPCHRRRTKLRCTLRKTRSRTGVMSQWRTRRAPITPADQMRRSKSTSSFSMLIKKCKMSIASKAELIDRSGIIDAKCPKSTSCFRRINFLFLVFLIEQDENEYEKDCFVTLTVHRRDL